MFALESRFRMLPQKVHTGVHYLLPEHHDGAIVTDIDYLQCSVWSDCELSAEEGWTKIPKDVYLGGAWLKKGYLHFKRKKETEFTPAAGEKVVLDVRLSRNQPLPSEGAGDKETAWEARPGGLWIKRQVKLSDAAITAVEVLFGPDAAEVREGWQLKEGSMSVGETPRLTVRRGQKVEVKKPQVMMPKNHKLKIIQVSGNSLSIAGG